MWFSGYKISNQIEYYSNNLKLTKLIAALMVIMAHAFPLTKGIAECVKYAGYSYLGKFGELAVAIFFFASGIMITKGLVQKGENGYFKMRLSRLIPSLAIVVCFCVLVLGPLVTTLAMKDYFTNLSTYRYFLNSVMILQHNLPGVFENNPYLPTINGSLWTLPVEFACYVMAYLAYKLRVLSPKNIKVTIPIVVLIYLIGMKYLGNTIFQSAMQATLFFYVGVLCYVYSARIVISNMLLAVLGGISITYFIITKSVFVFLIFLPYILCSFWFNEKQCSDKVCFLGTYTYEIYLVAFPIAQSLVYISSGEMGTFCNVILTAIISVICAIGIKKLVKILFAAH